MPSNMTILTLRIESEQIQIDLNSERASERVLVLLDIIERGKYEQYVSINDLTEVVSNKWNELNKKEERQQVQLKYQNKVLTESTCCKSIRRRLGDPIEYFILLEEFKKIKSDLSAVVSSTPDENYGNIQDLNAPSISHNNNNNNNSSIKSQPESNKKEPKSNYQLVLPTEIVVGDNKSLQETKNTLHFRPISGMDYFPQNTSIDIFYKDSDEIYGADLYDAVYRAVLQKNIELIHSYYDEFDTKNKFYDMTQEAMLDAKYESDIGAISIMLIQPKFIQIDPEKMHTISGLSKLGGNGGLTLRIEFNPQYGPEKKKKAMQEKTANNNNNNTNCKLNKNTLTGDENVKIDWTSLSNEFKADFSAFTQKIRQNESPGDYWAKLSLEKQSGYMDYYQTDKEPDQNPIENANTNSVTKNFPVTSSISPAPATQTSTIAWNEEKLREFFKPLKWNNITVSKNALTGVFTVEIKYRNKGELDSLKQLRGYDELSNAYKLEYYHNKTLLFSGKTKIVLTPKPSPQPSPQQTGNLI